MNRRRHLRILGIFVTGTACFADPLRVEPSGQLESTIPIGGNVFGMQSTAAGAAVDTGAGSKVYNGNTSFFTSVRLPIALLPDGEFVGASSDTNHIVAKTGGVFSSPPPRDSSVILTAVAGLPDGKVLVGTTSGFFRLNSDGSLDSSFSFGTATFGGAVKTILIAADGRIVVVTTGDIQRLMNDGMPDNSFSKSTFQFGNCNGAAFQPNGMILVAGTFTQVNNTPHPVLVRFDSFGNLDFFFSPPSAKVGESPLGGLTSISAQSDGAFVVGSPIGVRRYFADGKPDIAFAPPRGQQGVVYTAIDQSGRVYYNDNVNGFEAIFQYSGHSRIVVPPASINTVLQHAATVAGPWTSVQSLTAGMSTDVLLREENSTGNEFFRIQPAP